jgi:hypothetical protein
VIQPGSQRLLVIESIPYLNLVDGEAPQRVPVQHARKQLVEIFGPTRDLKPPAVLTEDLVVRVLASRAGKKNQHYVQNTHTTKPYIASKTSRRT